MGRERALPVAKKELPARPLAVLFILGLLAALIYSNSFSVPFHFDDPRSIVDNPVIRDLSNFLDLSGTRYMGLLSFALNYHFGGLNVFGYHLVNLLIHITNGFLVYSLVLLLFQSVASDPSRPGQELAGGPVAALAAALLFIAHPIQTQAVTYIVQRFASLTTLFYLLGMVGYLKWRLGGRFFWYGAALISTLLAMKTKENSFTLPLMFLLSELAFFRPSSKKHWLALLPFFLMLLIIPLSRWDALGEGQAFTGNEWVLSRSDYLFTEFRVIVTYLRLLFLPINQSVDHDYPIFRSLFHPSVFLSFLFLLSLSGFALHRLFRRRQSTDSSLRWRLMSFGILWFFLTLSVESSIFPIQDVINEHRLYLPSVGIFLAVAVGLLWGSPTFGRVVTVVLIVLILGGATYRRNLVWANGVTLWRDVVEKEKEERFGKLWQDVVERGPKRARGHNNLGTAYANQGRLPEAAREYEAAIKLQPDYAEAYSNLGSVYGTEGRTAEAIQLYEKALELKPDYAEARKNLEIVRAGHQDGLDQEIDRYQKELSQQGDSAGTHFKLGTTYEKKGKMEEAIREYQTASTLKPDLPDYPYALGNAYANTERPDDAIRAYEVALKLKPDFAEAYYALGNVYAGQERLDEARKSYEAALKFNPNYAEAHNNLGNVHTLQGRYEEAIREYRQALALKPDYAEAYRNIGFATKKLGRQP